MLDPFLGLKVLQSCCQGPGGSARQHMSISRAGIADVMCVDQVARPEEEHEGEAEGLETSTASDDSGQGPWTVVTSPTHARHASDEACSPQPLDPSPVEQEQEQEHDGAQHRVIHHCSCECLRSCRISISMVHYQREHSALWQMGAQI